jgi:prepilin-type processing-associated H-X9-DG protein
MTRLEVLCVVAVVLIVVAMIIPPRHGSREKARAIKCVNNLKNVGIAYRIWAEDNKGLFPFHVSTNQSGSMELREDIAAQFRVLSNELSTPKIIFCPALDLKVAEATNWTSLNRTNITYYIGVSALETNGASILSGDSGFTINNAGVKPALNEIRSSTQLLYPKDIHDGRANIVLADGSAHRFINKEWPQYLQAAGTATNLFLLP